MSLTGAFADHRLVAPPEAIEAMIAALASGLGAPNPQPELPRTTRSFVDAIAKDLQAHPGRGLVLVGPSLPNAAPLGVWLNDRLGAPVDGFEPDLGVSEAASLAELATDIDATASKPLSL